MRDPGMQAGDRKRLRLYGTACYGADIFRADLPACRIEQIDAAPGAYREIFLERDKGK